MKFTLSLFLFFISHILLAGAGDTLNYVDSAGKRQGYWKITAAMKNRTDFPSTDAIVEEGRYINSQKNGWWIEYYPNGNPRSKMEYANNRPNGTATLYFENGHVSETGTWKGSRWIGEYRRYYEDDTLRQIFHYNMLGQKNGVQYYYWPNGKIEMDVNYLVGKEEGWTHYYYEDGSAEKDVYRSSFDSDSTKVICYPPRNTSLRGHSSNDQSGPEVEAELPVVRTITSRQEVFLDSVLQTIPCYPGPDSLDKFRGPRGNLPGGSSRDFRGEGYYTLFQNGSIDMKGNFIHYKLMCGIKYVYDGTGALTLVKVYEDGKLTRAVPVPDF